jgi:hypothetical protein
MSQEFIRCAAGQAHLDVSYQVARRYLLAAHRGIHHPRLMGRIMRLLSPRDWRIPW